MLQQLFGAELDFSVRLAVSLIVIAALLGVTVFVMRKLGGGVPGRASGRGRSGPRLAIVDAIAIDPRRRLVLVRRDDVEHLLLTGGTNDVLVEQNITGSYVATANLRPAMPLERETQRAVQPPAAKAPLAARPEAARETAQLPPAPPPPDALAAGMAAAALAAPAAEARAPQRPALEIQRRAPEAPPAEPARPQQREAVPQPLPEARQRPAAPEPAVEARTAARAQEPVPAPAAKVAVPEAPAREAPAREAPAPDAPEALRSRADALLANAERRKAQAVALRQRLPSLSAEQKREALDTIKRIDLRVARTLKDAEQLLATAERREAAPAVAPRLPEHEAKRGLALLLGTEPPAAKKDEAPAASVAPVPPATDGATADAAAKAAAAKAAAQKAAAEKAAAEKAAAQKAAVEKAEAERLTAQKVAAEKAAAEKAAAEKAAVEKVAAERAAAQKAAAEKAAAERTAAQKAATERAAAQKIAAEKAAAERAAAEKAAAEKAAAEKALADEIAAELAAALEEHQAAAPEVHADAPASPDVRPAARIEPAEGTRPRPAVEPRLQEMAQRLDAALSRPSDDKLRLSLSDLLEDIEGAAAEANVPMAAPPERPRLPVTPRRPAEPVAPRPEPRVEPRAEPRPQAGRASADYARFLSDEPSEARRGGTSARTQARELFSDGWTRATRRLDHAEEPARQAPEVTARPARSGEPTRPREPLPGVRRAEPTPVANVLPKMQATPVAPKPADEDEAKDEGDSFLDEFDAEMATLLGRTPSR